MTLEVIPPIYDMVSEPGENGLIRAEYYADGIDLGGHNYVSKANVVTRFFNVNGTSGRSEMTIWSISLQ